jgi:RNA polymerase sigma factor (sigma-70 family)
MSLTEILADEGVRAPFMNWPWVKCFSRHFSFSTADQAFIISRMAFESGKPDDAALLGEDLRLAERCREGDTAALAVLRERHSGSLMNILVARGANPAEAEDVLGDVWARCVPGGEDHPSLLEKYNGKCPVQNWLCRVATNRWLDGKRREKYWSEPPPSDEGQTTFVNRVPDQVREDLDSTLVGMLRDSLRAAFGQCPPHALVLLHLVYRHGVTQREVMRMLSWSESKVSRALSGAMEQIRDRTLAEVKKRDPWLHPTWQDFVELCQSEPLGFF